jgi:valyl-tRNA synthetase
MNKGSVMDIPAKYDPSKTESKWYSYWLKHQFFESTPDQREPYTIVIPPPNVTGVLHMGHMLNNTIQDILVRRARMLGKNTLWLPGTDHASIATEARVVASLRGKGIKKSDLTREEFLEYAWEWKNKHGGIILEQLKKLGASCDWSRTRFTMDPEMSESVIHVFVDLYNKGHIYRGLRMVNWDPQAKTAISNEEVIYRELNSKLYYVRYKIDGNKDWLIIATTRPETILGDTAVCVHPEDKRYHKYRGRRIIIPLVNRPVPLIEDEYVDMEFGTGALKITPAHDENDYEIGLRHKLDVIDIFNDDGTLNENALLFVGKDRFEARELVVRQLEEEGYLVKTEKYVNKVGFSERTDVAIEPRLSLQWFMRMKELAQPALQSVLSDEVQLHPRKFKNIYRHWMENVKDWCISRQLWWGHRIPAYYFPGPAGKENFVVAETPEQALALAKKKSGNIRLTLTDLKQDEDVLDTWFSSWLWPISTLDGIRNPKNKDFAYYYPTNDLVTAPEILFFWVARMIMAGYEYAGNKPFHHVYLTGIVRDKLGRKMSKSLGNSPEPLELIKNYGADGVRVGMLLCSPAGNDLLFDESLTEQGRNFGNKIWNAFRLIHGWKVDEALSQPVYAARAAEWFESKLFEAIKRLEGLYASYRLSEALMVLYKLFWDEFASWYLEIIKPVYGKPMDKATYEKTITFLEELLKLLHPMMPFITEEIWQSLRKRKEGETIMLQPVPVAGRVHHKIIDQFEIAKEIVSNMRTVRKEKNIQKKEVLHLFIRHGEREFNLRFGEIVMKLCHLSGMEIVRDKPTGAASFMVRTTEFFIPLQGMLDVKEEAKRIKKELEYLRGFLVSVVKKLDNERFMASAPAHVIQLEKNKKNDAEAKISRLEEQLKGLK